MSFTLHTKKPHFEYNPLDAFRGMTLHELVFFKEGAILHIWRASPTQTMIRLQHADGREYHFDRRDNYRALKLCELGRQVRASGQVERFSHKGASDPKVIVPQKEEWSFDEAIFEKVRADLKYCIACAEEWSTPDTEAPLGLEGLSEEALAVFRCLRAESPIWMVPELYSIMLELHGKRLLKVRFDGKVGLHPQAQSLKVPNGPMMQVTYVQ